MGTLPDGSKIEEFSMTQFSMFLTDFFLGYFTQTDDFHQLDFEISSNIFNPRIHIQRDFHGVNCHPLGLTLRGWWLRESLAVRPGSSDKQLTGWRLVDVGGLYTGLSYHPIEFCITYVTYLQHYVYDEWSSLLGQVMNLSLFAELLREFRWWSGPSAVGCPWGAIGLVALLVSLCCWACGFITASCLLSQHCRRFVGLVIRALVASVPLAPAGPDLRGRLAEYHFRSG